ncbi:MAG: hypothetical protein HQK65_11405 [Desulfamplus sp.]|nr:hypothetical protein [Desulfamplus sp.]
MNGLKVGKDNYDTAINVIGGLKDYEVICSAIDSHFNRTESLKEIVTQHNELTLRTEKIRIRIEREVRTPGQLKKYLDADW